MLETTQKGGIKMSYKSFLLKRSIGYLIMLPTCYFYSLFCGYMFFGIDFGVAFIIIWSITLIIGNNLITEKNEGLK